VKNERWQINEITGRKERKRIRFKEKKEGKGRSLHYFEKNIGVRRYTICILAVKIIPIYLNHHMQLKIT
jgi:hypothetical protein